MLFRELIHPVFTFLKRKDYYSQPDSSLQTEFPRQGCIAPGFFILADKIFSSGMHRPRIFHPCRQNLLGRDASPRDFSSLQTESPRHGCVVPEVFLPADRISSAGMHRPRIFHPCRQNLLVRDASSPQLWPKLAGRTRSPPSSPQFTSTLAGRTLIKPAVPIFKLPAFIPDDLFPVSRSTFRIQLRITSSVSA